MKYTAPGRRYGHRDRDRERERERKREIYVYTIVDLWSKRERADILFPFFLSLSVLSILFSLCVSRSVRKIAGLKNGTKINLHCRRRRACCSTPCFCCRSAAGSSSRETKSEEERDVRTALSSLINHQRSRCCCQNERSDIFIFRLEAQSLKPTTKGRIFSCFQSAPSTIYLLCWRDLRTLLQSIVQEHFQGVRTVYF